MNRLLFLVLLMVLILVLGININVVAQTFQVNDEKSEEVTFDVITSIPRSMTYQGILKDSGGDPFNITNIAGYNKAPSTIVGSHRTRRAK